MLAIYKRELKSYFHTVIGWLFLAVTLCMFGLYFFVYNLSYGYANISYALSSLTFIFLLTIPVLTMRILAEERKTKTDQLLLTAPVSVGKIVLGKFLALASIFSMAVLVICVTPLLLTSFGDIPMAQCYVAVFGFWLYGCTCISIGVFVSSITESQVIAAVISFVFLFVGYMMSGLTNIISSSGNLLTKILNGYNLNIKLDNFTSGMFDITGVVYYVSLTALFLFFTTQSIEKRRWSISTKQIKTGVFSSGFIAVALVLTVIINLVAEELPTTWTQIDITNNKIYSLTEDTYAVLDGVEDDITIYVLVATGSKDETLDKTLDQYQAANGHIKVEYVDPDESPNFYTAYTEEAPTTNSMIVVRGDSSKVVSYDNIYETEIDYTTYQQSITGYDAEGQITSAINYVIDENKTVIYTVTGHSETELDTSFTDALEKMNIQVESLNLMDVDTVPEDAECLIINGPTSDFSADDAQKVNDYLTTGGKAMINVGYAQDADMTNFYGVLANYQISIAKGIVFEGDSGSYYQQPYYLLPTINDSDYTADVDNYIFMPYVLGMSYDSSALGENITITDILTTSDNAFSKVDVSSTTAEKEEGDIDGPFTVGLMVEATNEDASTSNIAVFSSSQLFTDAADSMVSGANLEVFKNVISSFVGEDTTATVSIDVKSYEVETVTIATSIGVTLGIIAIFVLPLLLLFIGVIIWIRRRKK